MNLLSQEDLEFRKTKIGASDAPVILEVSPWRTPYQLWLEKMSLVEPQEINSAMQRGNQLEEVARQEFERQTGLTMFGNIRKIHPEIEYMMATYDGIDLDEENILEIKCPGVVDHEIAMDGQIPEKYFPQLQHQMIVAGLEKAYYFSYREDSNKIIEVYRDDEYCKLLLKKEFEFNECLKNFEAPKLTERDYRERNDELWKYTVDQWKNAKERLKELEEREKNLRETLIHLCGSCNTKGAGITVTKIARKGAIDYSDIPELKGVNLELYRKKPIESWRITT